MRVLSSNKRLNSAFLIFSYYMFFCNSFSLCFLFLSVFLSSLCSTCQGPLSLDCFAAKLQSLAQCIPQFVRLLPEYSYFSNGFRRFLPSKRFALRGQFCIYLLNHSSVPFVRCGRHVANIVKCDCRSFLDSSR